jgi:hypothetical protein
MNEIINSLLVLLATEAVGGNGFFYEGDKGEIVLHRGPVGTAEQSSRFSNTGIVSQKTPVIHNRIS